MANDKRRSLLPGFSDHPLMRQQSMANMSPSFGGSLRANVVKKTADDVSLVQINHPDGPKLIGLDETVNLDVPETPEFITFKGPREKWPITLGIEQRQTVKELHSLLSVAARPEVTGLMPRHPFPSELRLGHFEYKATRPNHAGVDKTKMNGCVTPYDINGRVMMLPTAFPTPGEAEACAAILNHALRLIRDPKTHHEVLSRTDDDFITGLHLTARESWQRLGEEMPRASMSASDADHMLATSGFDVRKYPEQCEVTEPTPMLYSAMMRVRLVGDPR